jgi:cytochrome c oxidase subunit 2
MPVMTLAQSDASFWLPPSASEGAAAIDWLFYLILYISAFFFVLILAVMVYFVIRYRRREGHAAQESPAHSTALELTWSLIPTALLVVIFYVGFTTYIDLYTAPQGGLNVNAIGRKWYWSFEYPDTGLIYTKDLHIPVGKAIKIVLSSEDVIHSLYVPAFRAKRDAVPGRYNKMWFRATKVGEFNLFCAEYCGTAHSTMIGKVIVHTEDDFKAWMANELIDLIEELTDEQFKEYRENPEAFKKKYPKLYEQLPVSLAVKGEELYNKKGCFQCHSTDGSASTGPTYKGLWGSQRLFTDGTSAVADENYISESVLDSPAKVVAGFNPVMPTFKGQFTDRQIMSLIEYIKSVK